MADEQVNSERTAWWAKFVLIGGVLAALLLVLAPIGYRLGVLGVQAAVLMLPGMGAALGVLVLLFALAGIVITLRRGLIRERVPLVVGGVLALVVVANMGAWFMRANSVPPIHDISTDPVDPPRFVAVVELRGPGTNPLDYDSEALAAVTREAYPFVQPVHSSLSPSDAFVRSLAIVEDFGWETVAVDPPGHIEATATTRLYGFKDDVVIRIGPDGSGSRIDLRSVSRVGQSDLGANAGRISAFIVAFGED
ncbi:MAG: DUF1499 domain-containing protein [Gammaproteobacteria bacterium]|nr:MAG: DUF1499 domain-containing protein [Gammaproteobacteria bacterium]